MHLYYPEMWHEIAQKLRNISEPFDLIVSLNEKDKEFGDEIRRLYQGAHVVVVPNRGRDVLPFLLLARHLDDVGYRFFLKLHSKRSPHRTDGSDWFSGVVAGLLPGEEAVAEVINKLRREPGVLIGPKGHEVSLKRHMGSNEPRLTDLLARIYGKQAADQIVNERDRYNFFGGTMFWVSAECVRPLLKLNLLPKDFEAERGQIDGTTAHAVERLISLLPQINHVPLYAASADGVSEARFVWPDEKYRHAP